MNKALRVPDSLYLALRPMLLVSDGDGESEDPAGAVGAAAELVFREFVENGPHMFTEEKIEAALDDFGQPFAI